jgi:hypothetical protein
MVQSTAALPAQAVATADEGRHAPLERLQLRQLVAQLRQVPCRHLSHFEARPVGLVDQPDQLAHLLDGEAEVAAPSGWLPRRGRCGQAM